MKGAPMSSTVEKMAAIASARRNAWKTRASARSRRPAPSARAIADETPAPMPLLVVCRTIITQGNASEAPASALVPMRPRKKPSNVITPANATRLRIFGAASRSSVGRIGPSSRSLVRAALDGVRPLAGANDDWEMEALRSLMGRSLSRRGTRQRLDEASFSEAGRLRMCPTAPFIARDRARPQHIISQTGPNFSHEVGGSVFRTMRVCPFARVPDWIAPWQDSPKLLCRRQVFHSFAPTAEGAEFRIHRLAFLDEAECEGAWQHEEIGKRE